MPVSQYMNGAVFCHYWSSEEDTRENHSKLSPGAHVGSNCKDQWYHIVGALGRWNLYVLSLCDMRGNT